MKRITASALFIAVVTILLSACSGQTPATTTQEPSTEETPIVQVSPEFLAPADDNVVLTLAEIAKHNAAADCWFAIEGKVYDVTEYIRGGKHPGGPAILAGCGTDATTIFNERPSDGEAHSAAARMGLEKFYLGELVEDASAKE